MEGPPASVLAALVAEEGAAALVAALGAAVAEAPGAAAALYARRGSGTDLELVARAGAMPDPGPAARLAARGERALCAALAAPGALLAPDGAQAAGERARAGLAGAELRGLRAAGEQVGALAWWAPPDEDARGVGALGDALALALARERLVDGVRERAGALDRQLRRAEALADTARAVSAAEGADLIPAVAAREARALLEADVALVALREPDGALHVVAGAGWAPGDPLPAVLELGRGGDADVVWLGREAAAVMARAPGEEPLGVLVAARRGGAPFDDDDLARLEALADQAGVALAGAALLERLRSEERERQSLAAALVSAQEAERRRVAEDIHDGPVQGLVGVSLLLDALAGELPARAPGAVAQVRRAAGAAREAVRSLRRAIGDLHPLSLQEQGFPAAVGALRRRLELQGAEVTVDVAAAAALAEPLRTVAFRTCQEAVANVLRHAEARRVTITAAAEGPDLVIAVRDDGRGFDPAGVRHTVADGHLGLAAMRERAQAFGADLRVTSREGRGTEVRLTLPDAAAPEGDTPGP